MEYTQPVFTAHQEVNQPIQFTKMAEERRKKTVRTINNAEIHDKTTPTKHGGTNSDVQKTQMKNMETWATTNIEAQ